MRIITMRHGCSRARRARPALLAMALGVAAALSACERGPTLDATLAARPLPGPTDSVDNALADAGAWYFRRNCSACHHIGEGPMVGPDLADVTRRRSAAWIIGMIQRPDSMLAHDSEAGRLLTEYQVPMADRRIDGPRARALLEFLRRADRGRSDG